MCSRIAGLHWSLREIPDASERFGRLGANRIVRVNIGRANDPILINDVPRRHGQPVSRLVVEPVQSASEGFVKLAKVIWQREHKAELLRDLQVKIRKDVETHVQLATQRARVAFEFRGDRHQSRSQRPQFAVDPL